MAERGQSRTVLAKNQLDLAGALNLDPRFAAPPDRQKWL